MVNNFKEETILDAIEYTAKSIIDKAGNNSLDSEEISKRISKEIRLKFGGSKVYIQSKDDKIKENILQDYKKGMTIKQLKDKYNTPKTSIYRYINDKK